MGNLIKSEFRKILTTKIWWALLIPTALLAFFYALGVGAFVNEFGNAVATDPTFRELGVSLSNLPLAVIALARSINLSVLLCAVFGVFAMATEIQRKTITTTFLTAPNRMSALFAKAITYVAWGAIFGVVISGLAALGSLATANEYYPNVGDTLLIILAGVVSGVLMTLIGVGLGAILGNAVAAVLIVVGYFLVVGPISDLLLANGVAGSLPNGAVNGLTSSTAADALIAQSESITNTSLFQAVGSPEFYDGLVFVLRASAGGLGAFSWWISGLIVLGWSAVFLVGGLLKNKQRDIT